MFELLSFLAAATLCTLGFAACLYALQRHLLFPAPKANSFLTSPHHHIQAVSIAVNGKVLRGYLARPITESSPRKGPLYFNGRRENPSSIFRALPELPDHQVLCFYYDRLGVAWRKPDEQELVSDALAVLDWWAQQSAIPVERISLAGRSLGSGIAVQVAAARRICRLVLISPHDQLINAIKHRLPWVPGAWLKDRFKSCDYIGDVCCPCLLIAGDRDNTIPISMSRALFAGWTGAFAEFAVRYCGHRGLLKRSDVHRVMAEFLGKPAASSAPVVGDSSGS